MVLSLLKFLPRKMISRWVGRLMHWQGPRWWAKISVKGFATLYRINLEEAELEYWEYPSIGAFFTRHLKQGARPLGKALVLHCADSVINAGGEVKSLKNETQLIQAKGLNYSLGDFLCDELAQERFLGGQFATYYLCPTDYHRLHSPVSGEITRVKWVPGDLWPVNNASVNGIENLFVRNERVIVEIATPSGAVAMVFVGATNVGSIHISSVPGLVTNQEVQGPLQTDFAPNVPVTKGDEVGYFSMGSTIVMVWSKGVIEAMAPGFKAEELIGKSVKVRSDLQSQG